MDDEAASQQLMSEARAPHSTGYDATAIPLNLGGASQHTIANTPGSSKKKSNKNKSNESSKNKSKNSKRQQLADSQLSVSPLTTYSLEDLQAFVSSSKTQASPSTAPSTQIEVPDSQLANGTLSPTPTTSSQAIPPDTVKSKSRKSKRKRQSETDALNETVPATPFEEAGEGPASQKRRKKHESQSVGVDATEIAGRPAATQDVTDALAHRNNQHDVLDAPLTPKALLHNLNAERSQRPQSSGNPPMSAQRQQEAPEATPVDVDAEEHLADTGEAIPHATDALTAESTPDVTQSASNQKKRTKKGKKMTEASKLDWEAPVRNLNDTPAQPFTFEDVDMTEATESQRKKKNKKKKTKSMNGVKPTRYSVGGLPTTPRKRLSRADPNKNYERARDDNDRTAADRALEMAHELGQPPDKRTSGDYSADEKELLRRAIRDYQERNGLDTADLVEIIHWSHIPKNATVGNTTDQAETEFRRENDAFWEEVRSAGLLRKFKDVKQHVRTNYHTRQRGSWSVDDDEQLRELVNLHPGEWKLIATQLNRLELDAFNRWNDYVRYGENRVTKRWSLDEEENFIKVLSAVCQRVEDYRAETGQPPLDDFTPVINWHEVCREMGDTRSRLQCQYKWKQMRARVPPPTLDVETKPRQTPPPGGMGTELKDSLKPRRTRGTKKRKSALAEADVKPPGPEDMLWGDKLDLVGCLVEQAFEGGVDAEDQIVWHDVAEKMHQARMVRWSVPTLQTAYKELCELVLDAEEDGKLQTRVMVLYGFLKNNHFSELEDHYQPKHDVEANGEDALQANSSRKRKRQSGAGSAKKRNQKTLDMKKSFKSKELVTESDNAESERES